MLESALLDMFRITINAIIINVFLVSGIALCQYRPSTAQRLSSPSPCSRDVPKKLHELQLDGEKIVRAIKNRDIKTLVKYFHEKGVTIGSDNLVSGNEIDKQIQERRGFVYSTLFDTKQLRTEWSNSIVITRETQNIVHPEERLMSLYDHFRGADRIIVNAEQVGKFRDGHYPIWAVLHFNWNHRPPQGIYYDPIFVCTENGWKFSTFFNTP
jgi:hypothetical protein